MSPVKTDDLVIKSVTQASFSQYLKEHPNNRRISNSEKENIIGWLKDSSKHPSSQKEFNRRNYVQKTFSWNEGTQTLVARARSSKEKDRIVVIEDNIFQVVELAHVENHHAGWDATWKLLSTTYYGILRSDMIYILKRCSCSPNRRPKRATARAIRSIQGSQVEDRGGVERWSISEEMENISTSQFLDPLQDYVSGQDAVYDAEPDAFGEVTRAWGSKGLEGCSVPQ